MNFFKKYFYVNLLLYILACSSENYNELVLIKGGKIKNPYSKYFGKDTIINDFYIGKYEVTQKEWYNIMGYNPSYFKGDNLPVEMISWYEAIEFCNKKSEKEGLLPYYIIDKTNKDVDNSEFDSIRWKVNINPKSNGYRLPTELEWEYAASGGQLSKGFLYSGSNNINDVAWYWRNAGKKFLTGYWFWSDIENNNSSTKSVGLKKPNELGLFDMSGNVREWCWDKADKKSLVPKGRVWKGGGWIGAEFCCEISFRGSFEANGKGPDQGFRICRSK